MNGRALNDWVELLTRTAGPVARSAGPALPGGAGVAFALAVTAQAGIAPDPLPYGDSGMWWALVDPNATAVVEALFDVDGDGPLLPPDRYLAIEVWTESELCGLHALIDLAITRQRGDWLKRTQRACEWHLRNTQPDHATARPWAIHGVLLLQSAEAQHYAEMLLHNCMAMQGKPDETSAWILLDAAHHLEQHLAQ